MTRRRVILVVGACVVVGILGVALWPREKEPEYQGKTLFRWLQQYQPYPAFGGATPFPVGEEAEEAMLAVRCVGTNGLPCMLMWLRNGERPNLVDKAAQLHDKLPAALRSRRLGNFLIAHGRRARASAAVSGFWILGHEARPALPELTRMADDITLGPTQNAAYLCIQLVNVDEVIR